MLNDKNIRDTYEKISKLSRLNACEEHEDDFLHVVDRILSKTQLMPDADQLDCVADNSRERNDVPGCGSIPSDYLKDQHTDSNRYFHT